VIHPIWRVDSSSELCQHNAIFVCSNAQGGPAVNFPPKLSQAAGSSAAALTTVAAGAAVVDAQQAPPVAPLAIPRRWRRKTATFTVNGKPYKASYERGHTLWEVIAVKLGLTARTEARNRGSCGACSVLLDGTPFYSCHMLATEAAGKKIFTVEGLGTEKICTRCSRSAIATWRPTADSARPDGK
jgi:hypothetical protein